jgi:biotin carboxyl carrier protein
MDLIVDGKPVRVRRREGGYEVDLEGRSHVVDAALARPGLYSLRLAGAQHEVVVRADGESTYWVSVGGTGARVTVTDPLSHLAAQATGEKGGRRRQRVTAYMPGRVATLLVEEGAEVDAGAGVVVLEAMKMQNEIRAEHGGRISRIFVTAGQAVDGGDPLFEIE